MPFEQGPIRPPSEAESLFIRVTRNCPWNRCVFCPVYKGRKFSRRSDEEILADIEEIAAGILRAKELSWRTGQGGSITRGAASAILSDPATAPAEACAAAWLYQGKGSIFLQDSDALVVPVGSMVRILKTLREKLPDVRRVTCYSRSATLARKGAAALREIREAGLDRVHVGMESGSDRVLELVRKGATAKIHVDGGRAAIEAGLELSEYVMPGLGGKELSSLHAVESARVIREISPHFVRLRSLGIRRGAPLFDMVERGEFKAPGDDDVVREIRSFIEHLGKTRTILASDHILNLLGDIEGKLPGDAPALLETIDAYLGLPQRERDIYRVGRRLGLFHSTRDLDDPDRRRTAENLALKAAGTPGGIDELCTRLLSGMI
jgi:hypothetical protein